MGLLENPLPDGAIELNRELVNLVVDAVNRHSDVGVPAAVGALLSVAFVVACNAYEGDKAEAIAVLQRHIDFFNKRQVPPGEKH
jgi:hypothetical protein